MTCDQRDLLIEEFNLRANDLEPFLYYAIGNRENLFLSVQKKIAINDLITKEESYLKSKKTFVFCNTVAIAREFEESLKEKGYRTGLILGVNHMSKGERKEVFSKFVSKELDIIVGTDALSLGVHYDVNHSIIYGLPSSIESYWQKAGRAGRVNSTEVARVHLYWGYQDVHELTWRTASLSDTNRIEQEESTSKVLRFRLLLFLF